jgi:hypothetical protein
VRCRFKRPRRRPARAPFRFRLGSITDAAAAPRRFQQLPPLSAGTVSVSALARGPVPHFLRRRVGGVVAPAPWRFQPPPPSAGTVFGFGSATGGASAFAAAARRFLQPLPSPSAGLCDRHRLGLRGRGRGIVAEAACAELPVTNSLSERMIVFSHSFAIQRLRSQKRQIKLMFTYFLGCR